MPQPFDYNCYEFPKNLLNSIDCTAGIQQSLFPTPVFQYELKDITICKKLSNLVKKIFQIMKKSGRNIVK